MSAFQFFSSQQIHDGNRFLPQESVLVFDSDGCFLERIHASDKEKNAVHYFDGILTPGFINAHVHLELSYLKSRISEGNGLHEFIREIEAQKLPSGEIIQEQIRIADDEMWRSGVVAAGDICNTDQTFSVKSSSHIYYHDFIEVYAFHPDRAQQAIEKGLRVAEHRMSLLSNKKQGAFSIVPHAPYSVSQKLFSLLSDYATENSSLLSIHMQENEDENLLFLNKTGRILLRLKEFGIDTSFFQSTGKNSLKSVLEFLPNHLKTLLVHSTFSTRNDVDFANQYNPDIYFCFCPRANYYIERRLPDFALFSELNNKLTLGTDSLASNHSLNMGEEIGFLLSNCVNLKLEEVLRWSTINGAKFLGIDDWAGSFENGKKPGLALLSNRSQKLFSEKIL